MGGASGKMAFAASEDAKETNELPVVQEVVPDPEPGEKEPVETTPVALTEPTESGGTESETAEEVKKQPDEDLVQVENTAGDVEETKAGGDTQQEEETQAEETPAVEEEELPKRRPALTADDLKTAPFDIRFPSTNQTKHCYTRYNEFYKCQKERGQGAPECEKYRRYYRSLCPSEWIEKWEEERELGIYPGPY